MRVLIVSVIALLFAVTAAWSQIVLYEEHFTNGVTALQWHAGYGDTTNNMEVDFMAGNPSGDGFIGKIGNNLSGGSVGLTYAGIQSLTDYTLTAYVYATVTPGSGPYNSLIFRYNTEIDTAYNSYYQFDTDFDSNQRLRFRKKVASSLPEVIRDWSAGEIPGGVPSSTGWHKMAIRGEGNQFWLYWDDQELPGCPYTDSAIPNGAFGVYIFNFTNPNDYTRVDDIVVTGEDTTGVAETTPRIPVASTLISAYPNPFNPSTIISFVLDRPEAVHLAVYDAQGRPVAKLLNGVMLPAGLHRLPFSAAGLPAGVYLTRLQTGPLQSTQRIVLVK
jgi:hypothetical protein